MSDSAEECIAELRAAEKAIEECQESVESVTAQRDDYARQLASIRGSMATVSVYEGLVDVSPVVMMVADLAKDHEALEQRIENALAACAGRPECEGIIHLLRGGSPIPDTIEDLDLPPGS